jgi:Nucleotide modification associated domain 1
MGVERFSSLPRQFMFKKLFLTINYEDNKPMLNTKFQYEAECKVCRDIFLKKTEDYGTSWRVLRPISIADQIFIKAQRIRTLQEKGIQKINEDITGEWKAIVNYGIIALIQEELIEENDWDLPKEKALELYDKHSAETFQLMQDKNHDYGEAWRSMSQESFADLILTKILRIKQIISNDGKTIASEGCDGNFRDIINYAVFALILLKEK